MTIREFDRWANIINAHEFLLRAKVARVRRSRSYHEAMMEEVAYHRAKAMEARG